MTDDHAPQPRPEPGPAWFNYALTVFIAVLFGAGVYSAAQAPPEAGNEHVGLAEARHWREEAAELAKEGHWAESLEKDLQGQEGRPPRRRGEGDSSSCADSTRRSSGASPQRRRSPRRARKSRRTKESDPRRTATARAIPRAWSPPIDPLARDFPCYTAGTKSAQRCGAVPKYHLPFVTRRELLGWIGVTSATSALGSLGCTSSASPAPPPPLNPFLSDAQRAVLGALADAVLPPDDAPGGNALGAIDYIEKLLTAFREDPPMIHAGGPYSGRTALPNDDGGASSTSPPDEFSTFLPLDRVAERAWRLRIFGSSGVPGGGPNDAILGPVVGLREAIERALAQAQAALPPHVAIGDLTADQRASLLFSLDKETQSTIIELVLEGCFTAPEYGGNAGLAGWKMT